MSFLMAFLVFLAGILTYMMFPRSDVYQLDMYRQEGNIVSFLNQHQAAKDYMTQMITRLTPEGGDTNNGQDGIVVFPPDNVMDMLPQMMGGSHDVADKTGDAADGKGYVSGLICLDANWAFTPCTTAAHRYVITYGCTPNWWGKQAERKMAWYKAMLKRSHGSGVCGILAPISDADGKNFDEGNNRFVANIDNSQRRVGFQQKTLENKTYYVVPTAVNQAVPLCGGERLICMTPYLSPYTQNPVVMWDSISNNYGAGHIPGDGHPLAGNMNMSDRVLTRDSLTTYAVSGVIRPTEKTDRSILQNHGGTDVVHLSCTEALCTLTAGAVQITNIPVAKTFSFTYQTDGNNRQDLSVSYIRQQSGKPGKPGKHGLFPQTATGNTAGPVLNAPVVGAGVLTSLSEAGILAIRLYRETQDTARIAKNARADKKRFGL